MLKKIILFLLFLTTPVFAMDNWEVAIKVRADKVESKVVLGSNLYATSGFDGQFDVLFFGSGTLQAYFVNDDNNLLFKDIRNITDQTTWTLKIDNKDNNATFLLIFWNANDLPEGYNFILSDPIENINIDMKSNSYYKIPNTAIKYLDILVKKE